MPSEDIVHVLRHVCDALAPGGLVVDLQAIRPSGRVEIDGKPVGRIDDTAFFTRAEQAVAGLDALADEGLLQRGASRTFDTLVHFESGAELVASIAASSERKLPGRVAARLRDTGPCAVRETSLARVLHGRAHRP